MADGDLVRRITITATGENIDSTKQSVQALEAATAALAATTAESNKRAAEAGAAYRDQTESLNSSSERFEITGAHAASLANHLRIATEAAYALSPAFRGMVNASIVPALRGVGTAVAATTAAIITGVNTTGTALVAGAVSIAEFSPALGGLSAGLTATGRAMEAFSPTATGLASTLLSRLSPALRALAVAQLVVDSWQLATERLKEYNEISANAVGVSTDFYQRVQKGAIDAGAKVEDLNAAFKRLNVSMQPELGGSIADKRIAELTKAGNFDGNGGLLDLKNANNAEQQIKAVARAYREAADNSERLAGIDLVKTVLGSEVADNLRNDNDYLDNVLRKARELSDTKIVSDEQLARAVMLQTNYDNALKVLSERWQPFKEVMTELGIKMHEAFTQDLTDIAAVATGLTTLFNKASDLIGLSWDKLVSGISGAVTLVDAAGNAYQANIPKAEEKSNNATPYENAINTMRRGIGQPSQVANARVETLRVYDAVRRDQSGDPNDKRQGPDTSAYDRATESLRKYIKVTEAAATSVDQGAEAQERFKAKAQLLAAAEKDGTPVTAAFAAEMDKLAGRAGDAAGALEKARIESSIKFDRATAFLSSEDVQIASELRKLYPDVTQALNSTYAAQMRFNNALHDVNATGRELTKGFASDFKNALEGGSSAWDSFAKAGSNALNKISDKLMNMAIDNLWSKAFGGSAGGLASLFGGLFGGGSSGPMTLGGPSGPVPFYANGTNDAPGGWSIVGEDGPELMNVPKGASILPNGQMPGGPSITTPINISIDATGADAAGLSRVQKQLEKLTASLPSIVVKTVKQSQNDRAL